MPAVHPPYIAIIDNGRQITDAEFHQDLGRFLRVARNFKLAMGSTVAIEWLSLYEHWLLVLAFNSLGITTLTYTTEEFVG
jgi:hypothetical protein